MASTVQDERQSAHNFDNSVVHHAAVKTRQVNANVSVNYFSRLRDPHLNVVFPKLISEYQRGS
jgi:hypothetical protein